MYGQMEYKHSTSLGSSCSRCLHESGAQIGCFLHWGYRGVLPAALGCRVWPIAHTACVNLLAISPKMAVSSEPVVFSADLHTLGLWWGRLCTFGLRGFQWAGVRVVVQ